MVRPRGGGRYELVAGERRFRAAQEAGLTRIPAVVRSMTDEESLIVALIENIQREDLNPIEAARAYKQLMDDYGLTQTQLGEQIGKQQSTISNVLRLLQLPAGDAGKHRRMASLTAEHGKTLLACEEPQRGTKCGRLPCSEPNSKDAGPADAARAAVRKGGPPPRMPTEGVDGKADDRSGSRSLYRAGRRGPLASRPGKTRLYVLLESSA